VSARAAKAFERGIDRIDKKEQDKENRRRTDEALEHLQTKQEEREAKLEIKKVVKETKKAAEAKEKAEDDRRRESAKRAGIEKATERLERKNSKAEKK